MGKAEDDLEISCLDFASIFPKPSELGLLQLINMVAEFQRRSQLQAQVFHDHVALQQQECVAINLMLSEELHVRPQSLWVGVFHEPDHVLHGPGGGVPAPRPPGVLPVWRRA